MQEACYIARQGFANIGLGLASVELQRNAHLVAVQCGHYVEESEEGTWEVIED